MDTSNLPELDPELDLVLQQKPTRSAPFTLYKKIVERLAIISLIQRERKRFRIRFAASTLCWLVAIVTVVLLMVLTDLPQFLMRSIPGGMGYYDYLKSEVILSSKVLIAFLVLLVLVGLGAKVVKVLLPSRRHAR